jgi:hypothetical protein
LHWIQPSELDQLVYGVEHKGESKNFADVFPGGRHQSVTVTAQRDQRPQESWLLCPGITHPGSNGQNRSNNRLEDQANVKRSAGASEELIDRAAEKLLHLRYDGGRKLRVTGKPGMAAASARPRVHPRGAGFGKHGFGSIFFDSLLRCYLWNDHDRPVL